MVNWNERLTASQAYEISEQPQSRIRDWRRRGLLRGIGRKSKTSARWSYTLREVLILRIMAAMPRPTRGQAERVRAVRKMAQDADLISPTDVVLYHPVGKVNLRGSPDAMIAKMQELKLLAAMFVPVGLLAKEVAAKR